MKTFLFIALLVAPVFADEASEALEAQIVALQTQADSLIADSLAVGLDVLVQANSTLAANNIAVIPHIGYGWSVSWDYPAFDFSDSTFSADKAPQKSLAILTLKMLYKGQVSGDFVRVRKDRINAESIAAIADIIK